MVAVDPEAIQVFYEESKTARADLDKVRDVYRNNTTTVLALATGAATFFGFSDSPKGLFYSLALAAYAVAVGLAAWIFWPRTWQMNMAIDMGDRLVGADGPSGDQARFDMAINNQAACTKNGNHISGRLGIATLYSALLVAVGLVVVFAGVNTLVNNGEDKPSVTKVEILKGDK